MAGGPAGGLWMNRYGIIQGRLSEPSEGFQETPKDWKREFELLGDLGLSHIEWVVTKKGFENNPILKENIHKYSGSISSICCDNIIDPRFTNFDFLESQLFPICASAKNNGIKNITIPLLEESDVTDSNKLNEFGSAIIKVRNAFPSLTFLFEIESDWETSMKILNLDSNFLITYDTGNISSLGLDHEEYIKKVGERIHTVHLKDRNGNRETVEPGSGITDFDGIFNSLRKNKIKPLYTLQTARGNSGIESETISRHLAYFKIKNEEKPI